MKTSTPGPGSLRRRNLPDCAVAAPVASDLRHRCTDASPSLRSSRLRDAKAAATQAESNEASITCPFHTAWPHCGPCPTPAPKGSVGWKPPSPGPAQCAANDDRRVSTDRGGTDAVIFSASLAHGIV